MSSLNVWDTKSVRRLDCAWLALDGADTRTTFELAARLGNSFLDVACGMGRFYGYLLKEKAGPFTYIGLDFSQPMLDLAKERYPEAANRMLASIVHNCFVLHDVTEPFPQYQQRWDVVLCNEIFIHLVPEQQHKLVHNLAQIAWRRAVITVQTRADLTPESPFDVQIIPLKKRRHFYNVLQNVDVFCAELMLKIPGVDICVGPHVDLVRGAQRVEIVVNRKVQSSGQ